jgi:peptide chain release factor 2
MTIEQHKELLKRVSAIQSYLKIEEKRMQLREEELRTQDPSFWDDPKKAEAKMKDIRGLKFWVETFDRVKGAADDLEVMFEFVKEGVSTEAEMEEAYKILNSEIEELEQYNEMEKIQKELEEIIKETHNTENADDNLEYPVEIKPKKKKASNTINA